MKKIFLFLIISLFFLPANNVNAGLTNVGGQLMLPPVPCTCPVPATWVLICDKKTGIPTPLLILPGADVNLNYNIFTPGTEQVGSYTPAPSYCGIGPVTDCKPNPAAVPPFTLGQFFPIPSPDTLGTGGVPSGPPVCTVQATAGAAGAGAAIGAGEAFNTNPGTTGLESTSFLNPQTEDFQTGTVPNISTNVTLTQSVQAPQVNLQPGAKGSNVEQLQRFLNANGANLAVDGDFGQLTRNALQNYQDRIGVNYGKYPGYYGQKTRDKIAEVSSGSTITPNFGANEAITISGNTGPEIIKAPNLSQILSRGSVGSDVADLQDYLIDRNTGPAARKLDQALKDDPNEKGHYGNLTTDAVTEFQRQHSGAIEKANGLHLLSTKPDVVTGAVDGNTINYLRQRGTVERISVPVVASSGVNPIIGEQVFSAGLSRGSAFDSKVTYYHVATENSFNSGKTVPITVINEDGTRSKVNMDKTFAVTRGSGTLYTEGTGLLKDGRMINIASGSGSNAVYKVVDNLGLGVENIPLQPFRHVAADRSHYNVGKLGQRFYVQELDGWEINYVDNQGINRTVVHDGVVQAVDVGGSIKGSGRFDLFIGGEDNLNLIDERLKTFGINIAQEGSANLTFQKLD